jgi:hypothetical protein
MWLCLSDSFFSIVDKAVAPDCLVVRARRQGDIERHFPKATVHRTPGSDYLFRAEITREEIADRLSELVLLTDYPNFKDSVKDDKLHSAYSRIWGIMSGLQSIAPFSRVGRKQGNLL